MTRARSPQDQLYFVNSVVDATLIGGLSLLALAGVSVFELPQPLALQISVVLQWVVNWPHFSATNHRLYSNTGRVKQFPVTSGVIPLLVVAAVAFAFAAPTTVAPYLIMFFMLWSPYHFSGQTVGISMIYLRRGEVTLTPVERFSLATFVFGTFITSSLAANVSGGAVGTFYGISYPSLGVPAFAPTIWTYVMYAGAAVFLGSLAWRRQRVPTIALLPALTQYTWFVWGWRVPAFYVFVPLFHSLQYLLIAWVVHLHERTPIASGATKLSRRWVARESMTWFVANLIGGAILFALLPRIANAAGIDLALATGVLIAGVQIHHFFVDGVIWKLRSPGVANPVGSTWNSLSSGATAKSDAA